MRVEDALRPVPDERGEGVPGVAPDLRLAGPGRLYRVEEGAGQRRAFRLNSTSRPFRPGTGTVQR